MSEFEIKITGLKEVQRSLYAYSQQLGDRVVRNALREGAKVVQKQARANAPKRTGTLRRNIVIKNSRINNGKRNETIGVYLTVNKSKKGARNDAFYGRFVEDGYISRGGNRIEGVRFMGRAFDSGKSSAVNQIIRAIEVGAEIVKRKTGLK